MDWLISGDFVYSVRPFIPVHPGGELLIKHMLYTDVTDHLTKFHPDQVLKEKLPRYCVGKIDASTFPNLRSRTKISQEFRELEKRMEKEGLFKPTYGYYIFECLKVFLCFYATFKIIMSGPTEWYIVLLTSLLHAFGNQQMAFLLHDFSHNEVTGSRTIDNAVSYFIANILGGISVGLWKDEHQTHHVVTNHVEHDPDIQLIPFVAISAKFFKGVYSSFHQRKLPFGSFAAMMVKI